MQILTNYGLEGERVAAFVRAHHLYATLLGGSDLLWIRDRTECFAAGNDQTAHAVLARLRATAENLPGGLPFGGGHRAGEEALAAAHRTARWAAAQILRDLADVIDSDQAQHLSQFAGADTERYGDWYTRAWRPSDEQIAELDSLRRQ